MPKRLLAASIHWFRWNSSYRRTPTRTTATDLETSQLFGSLYQFALGILYTVSPTHSSTFTHTFVIFALRYGKPLQLYSFYILIRKLEECLDELGGKVNVGEVWFDGDVPLFHVKFHTRKALTNLLAGKSEMEEKLKNKLQSKLQSYYGTAYMSTTSWHTAYIAH